MYVWIRAGPSRGSGYLTRRRHQQNAGSDGRCMAEGGVAASRPAGLSELRQSGEAIIRHGICHILQNRRNGDSVPHIE